MCLSIIEVLFLGGGLWTLVVGKIPTGLFSILFGKGRYELPPLRARLFGLMLASALPADLIGSFLLTYFFHSDGLTYALVFEIIYAVTICIVATVIARKIRQPDVNGNASKSANQKVKGYGGRLLVTVGIILLTFTTFISGLTLISLVGLAVLGRGHWTGNFWQDEFPFVILASIFGIGGFGWYKLRQLLKAEN